MAGTHTIVINGRHYDTQTGLPVDTPAEEVPQVQTRTNTGTTSTGIHVQLQKSKTLNRQFVQHTTQSHAHPTIPRPTNGPKRMDISRSSSISRFAAHPVVQPKTESDMVVA